MLLKPTLFATLLGSSVAYAQLPQSSEALGAYANHVNSNGSSTPYRPFQVMTNTQQETAPAKPRGFTSRYLGVKYTPQKTEETPTSTERTAVAQNGPQPSGQQAPAPQQQPVRQNIRPVSYTYPTTQYNQYNQASVSYDQTVPGRVATLSCVIHAARSEGVPLYVLLGIHSKERGTNGQTVQNKNLSLDMGQFQINTIHFKRGGMFESYNSHYVRTDGCLNARLAAKILRNRLTTKPSTDFWVRAAAYHSWTPSFNAIYRNGTAKQPGLVAYALQWKKWLERKGINPN